MSNLTPSKVCVHTYIASSPDKILELSKPSESIEWDKDPNIYPARLDEEKNITAREHDGKEWRNL